MTLELGRRLLASGAATSAQVQAALYAHVTRALPFPRALVEVAGVEPAALDLEAARSPIPELRKVVPLLDLARRLPSGICHGLMAVPVRVDPLTATIDVATIDPFDHHIPREFEFHLGAPVRIVRSGFAAIHDALDTVGRDEDERAGRDAKRRPRAPTPVFGSRVVRAPIATRTGSSELPIPLVRRSQAPKPLTPPVEPVIADSHDPEDGARITQDAIILDPGSLPAARPSAVDAARTADGVTLEAIRVRIPAAPALPTLDQDRPPSSTHSTPSRRGQRRPSTAPELTNAVEQLDAALAALERATTRDDVVLSILRGMASVAGRVGILAVRNSTFSGWACTPDFADESLFRSISVERNAPTILAEATERGWYLGQIPTTQEHDQLLQLLRGHTGEVAVTAVLLSGRAVMLILAAQLIDSMIATRTAERLASAGANALLRVLRLEKAQGR